MAWALCAPDERDLMNTKSTVTSVSLLVLAMLLLGLSVGAAWVVADDFSERVMVPDGVTLEGVSMAGMTEDEARAVIEEKITAPLMQPIMVVFKDEEFTFEPSEALAVDVETMLDQTFSPITQTTLAERAYRRLLEDPRVIEVEPALDVDGSSLERWVSSIASKVNTPSVDATMTLVNDEVIVQQSAVGYETDEQGAIEAVTAALFAGEKEIELPVAKIEPEVTEEGMGKSIVVDLSERKLYLYDGTTLEKTYGVAIGTPRHSTPRGSWQIIEKRYMPTWGNPGSSWAASMPAFIGPGPSNPLGTRAINLDAPGIRIHGTTQDWSIGRAASHGCMRMHRWDVEDLYERVEVGMPVFIVS